MRRACGKGLTIAALSGLLLGAGCATDQVGVPGVDGASKTSATQRAERRLFDGAPPVIPHERYSASCVSCHGEEGIAVPGVGFSPPSPHEATAGMSAISWCRQCHVHQVGVEDLVPNSFVGLRQDLRRGARLGPGAPPVIPHPVFMRENCAACHSGPAAREEIRTTHPERVRCQQCHLLQTTVGEFSPTGS